MACFLLASRYYINQGGLIISEVFWHSSEKIFDMSLKINIIDLSLQLHLPGAIIWIFFLNELQSFVIDICIYFPIHIVSKMKWF